MRETVSMVCLIMGEGSERTKCSMKNMRSESGRDEEDVFMTENAEKVVFQQQEKNGKKCLLRSDVLTMENIAEEMVFQQWEKWGNGKMGTGNGKEKK